MRSRLGSMRSYQGFVSVWFTVTMAAALVTLSRADHIADLLFHGLFNSLLVLPAAFVLATSSGLAARLLRLMGWLGVAAAAASLQLASNGSSVRLWGKYSSDLARPAVMLVVCLTLAVWGIFAVNSETTDRPKGRLWSLNG